MLQIVRTVHEIQKFRAPIVDGNAAEIKYAWITIKFIALTTALQTQILPYSASLNLT